MTDKKIILEGDGVAEGVGLEKTGDLVRGSSLSHTPGELRSSRFTSPIVATTLAMHRARLPKGADHLPHVIGFHAIPANEIDPEPQR